MTEAKSAHTSLIRLEAHSETKSTHEIGEVEGQMREDDGSPNLGSQIPTVDVVEFYGHRENGNMEGDRKVWESLLTVLHGSNIYK